MESRVDSACISNKAAVGLVGRSGVVPQVHSNDHAPGLCFDLGPVHGQKFAA